MFRNRLIGALFAIASPLNAQQTTTGILPDSEGWYLPAFDGAGELFVLEIGRPAVEDAPPTVVLHGGPGGDLTYMLPVAGGLTDRFRFVFYDQRGSLRSRVVPDSISMAKHVRDLEELRRALGTPRINLLSHSAGTLLALEYLDAYPERVENLVLAGALPHKNGREYFDEEYSALWSGLAEEAEAFREREEIESELRRAGVARPAGPRERARAALIRQVGAASFHVERWRDALPMRVDREAAIRTRETTDFDYDYSTLIGSHPRAVTVINGELDYTVGPRGSPLWRLLAERDAPRLEVVVIPEAGHNVWLDDPDGFRRALARALTGR